MLFEKLKQTGLTDSKIGRLWSISWANRLRKINKLLVSDRKYYIKHHQLRKGVKPNLEAPQTFSENLLYLMLHFRNPLLGLCADKYYVQEYVKACGLEHILKKIYGVYADAREIDLAALPGEFFIKCNHLSGNNMIINQQEQVDFDYVRKLYNALLKIDYYLINRDWSYKLIRPRIICEECLRDKSGNLPVDYKFYCFGGEPKYFMVSYGEFEHRVRNHKFDMEFNSIDHFFKGPNQTVVPADSITRPANFEELVAVVAKLCRPFPHVRVDMYDLDSRIVFGELTFFSDGGVVNVHDPAMDRRIGSWFQLQNYHQDLV